MSVTVFLVVGCHWMVLGIPTRITVLLSGIKNGLNPVGVGIAEVHAVACGTEVAYVKVLKMAPPNAKFEL